MQAKEIEHYCWQGVKPPAGTSPAASVGGGKPPARSEGEAWGAQGKAGIPVRCDHTVNEQVEALFKRVETATLESQTESNLRP